MSRESTDDLKKRLLADPEVQLMVRMRAFELYQTRGGHGGSASDDWFRAESEVLTFLIAEEGRRTAEEVQAPSPETVAGVELAARADESADPETSLGAWSAAEPAGLELAPAPGGAAAMETPKKTRARSATKTAATKTAAPRAKKVGDDTAKKTAAKTTAQRTAAEKTAHPAEKPKRSRKKAEPPTQTSE